MLVPVLSVLLVVFFLIICLLFFFKLFNGSPSLLLQLLIYVSISKVGVRKSVNHKDEERRFVVTSLCLGLETCSGSFSAEGGR